jgi:hypothetical protein
MPGKLVIGNAGYQNYLKTENQKCDCEKLIKQEGKTAPSPVPAIHNHFHLDESFYPSRIISTEGFCNTEISVRCLARHVFMEKIMLSRLDRPPQIS